MSYLRKIRQLVVDSFGFSKTEANGFLILIVLVLLLAVVPRYVIHKYRQNTNKDSDDSLELWAAEMKASIRKKEQEIATNNRVVQTQHMFDPNKGSVEELLDGGVPKFLAERIAKYRSKGGRFQEPQDLRKIYGMTDSLYSSIENYITISKTTKNKDSSGFVKINRTRLELDKISIEINTATPEELQQIRGIGPILSKRIIKYRDILGGFHSFEQLKEVYGLKVETIGVILDQVTISNQVNHITINTDSIKHLAKHPYIDFNLARAIVNYRKVHGEYQSSDELLEIKVMNDSLYQRLSPYLSL